MASSATWALQKSIFEKLVNSPDVTNLLGGPKIYDHVPQRTHYPYVTFGLTQSRDWSTGTEDGQEHLVTLHVWSQAGGKKQTHEILGALRDVLHDEALPLDGHSLVNLRHEYSDARRDPDGDGYHGIIRYRAVTEPIM